MERTSPPPVRTSSAGKRVVGFVSETSPSSVLRFGSSDSPALSSGLTRALSQHDLTRDLPKLSQLRINTGAAKRGGLLKKSKSYADLQQRPPRSPPAETGLRISSSSKQATAPSSPQHSGSSGARAEPVQIPLHLARAKTAPQELPADELLSTPALSVASSWASHRGAHPRDDASPSHRASAGSLSKVLFEAQGDVVTAQAQAQGLHAALRKEQEEVLRLRAALELMTAERDQLLHELSGGHASAAVFDLDDSMAAAAPAPPAPRAPAPALRTGSGGGRRAATPTGGDAGAAPAPAMAELQLPRKRSGAAGRLSALRLR